MKPIYLKLGKNLNTRLFDDKLRKYEERFVELLLDLAQQKRVNPKISKINSYLLIHGSLTQKELKKLTGLSVGTISTYLSVIMGMGSIQRELIPGSHEYTYSFPGDLKSLVAKGPEIMASSFNSSEKFLKNKKKTLKKLIAESKVGAKHLSERIDEVLEVFELYKDIFK